MASSVFKFAKKNLGLFHLRILDTGLTITPYSISLRMSHLISINELRKVVRLQPQNMITLTKILVSKLDKLTTNNNSFTNQLKGFSKSPLREILNCVRVLTRILPLLMEEAASNDPTSPTSTSFSTHEGNSNNKSHNEKAVWINNLLWGTQQQDSKAEEDLQRSQFVLDEDDQMIKIRLKHTTNEDKPALMVTLIDTILDLLFLPGVCVPAAIMTNSQSGSSTSRYPIWTEGSDLLKLQSIIHHLITQQKPSLTTQLSSSGNSSSIYYGGASSAGISQDLPGWSAALLSVLLLPDQSKIEDNLSNNKTMKSVLPRTERRLLKNQWIRIYLSKFIEQMI
ncbi:hypothetical protein KEM48_013481 [Puccinia striiformis f. sp. tritici PST-130]|nr:hypothetical protein KEM48_013481 [Puccinia striiformis f. sp. tritici PST-130]